jgi:Protein-tyrosine-phosphatase
MKRICFVCHANICRSFGAQCILNNLADKDNNKKIVAVSRGIYAQDYYAVPDKMWDFLASKGIKKTDHKSTLLTKQDLENCDLILTMTAEQKEDILDKYAQFTDKVFMLQEYIYDKEEEVKDPISFSGSSFNKVMEKVYTVVCDLYEKIK